MHSRREYAVASIGDETVSNDCFVFWQCYTKHIDKGSAMKAGFS